jgi:hypothetical protein
LLAVLAADPWQPVRFLTGEWVAEEGGGRPGQASAGGSSFVFELNDTVLVRRSFSEYPASGTRPAFRHDDLLFIYSEGGALRAIYFDNEGHVIHYEVESSAPDVVRLTSAPARNEPGYRLTYRKTGEKTLAVEFDMAPAGKPGAFANYVRGSMRRK